MAADSVGGLRNFKVPSTHQVLSNATLDFFARLVERSSSCTFDSNKFRTCRLRML